MKRSLQIVVFSILMLSSWKAFGTAQFPDSLIYQEETHPIYTNPLESYFNNNNPKPADIFRFSCTACWRGYIATWRIVDKHLYLIKLVEGTCQSDAKEIPLSMVFPTQKSPIKATWYSGTIRIPQGKRLQYVHMGYESIYERDLFLKIEKGKMIEEYVVDNVDKLLHEQKERP